MVVRNKTLCFRFNGLATFIFLKLLLRCEKATATMSIRIFSGSEIFRHLNGLKHVMRTISNIELRPDPVPHRLEVCMSLDLRISCLNS